MPTINKKTRAQTAAIHAANAVKRMRGTRFGQDTAAIYAKELVLEGTTAATAVENGYRVGMGLKLFA